jgi:hypothetical protein
MGVHMCVPRSIIEEHGWGAEGRTVSSRALKHAPEYLEPPRGLQVKGLTQMDTALMAQGWNEGRQTAQPRTCACYAVASEARLARAGKASRHAGTLAIWGALVSRHARRATTQLCKSGAR